VLPRRLTRGTDPVATAFFSLATGPKKVSAYNQFMKDELARLKVQDKNLDHKQAFKLAAANWSKHKSK
jgi:hypothetical protein